MQILAIDYLIIVLLVYFSSSFALLFFVKPHAGLKRLCLQMHTCYVGVAEILSYLWLWFCFSLLSCSLGLDSLFMVCYCLLVSYASALSQFHSLPLHVF